MATNEILQFANTSVNILSQAAYSADAQRQQGHQPGIARDELENKALKQTSLVSSGVAQFIADNQAANVTDALTPAQVAEYLLDAINAASGSSGVSFEFTQTAHGLTGVKPVKLVGSNYALAQGNSTANAECVGFATVLDVNTLKINLAGKVTGLSGLTAATAYYLSTSVAGNLTATDPLIGGTSGQVSKPVLIADTTTSGFIFNMRGVEIGSPSALVEASSAEAIAGTVQGKYISPLRLRDGFNATGTAPLYACRSWVNFNGTGTVAIRASGNVSSITDNGIGDYTINFTTALSDTNYSVSGMIRAAASNPNYTTTATTLSAGSLRILIIGATGGTSDMDTIMIAIFR